MLCYICQQNEATVHLAQIADGKMQKVDLCEACAKEKGVQDATNVSLASVLMGLGIEDEIKIENEGARCAACGFTQADFKKTGRLGCAECWTSFEPALKPLIKAMHKGQRHVGKIPARAAHTVVISEQIKTLNDNLDRAVQDEKYEDAALIRDKIRELECQLTAKPKD